MTPSPNRQAAAAWYQAQADAAQAPRLREELRTAHALLRDARLRIPNIDPLALRIDDALNGRPVVEFPEEDTDLVWEQLPDGSWTWLRADMTRDRRP